MYIIINQIVWEYYNLLIDFTCAIPATKANKDRRGGRQCFLPDSWQQTFGKQSHVLLQLFGCKSYSGGGGAVHCK